MSLSRPLAAAALAAILAAPLPAGAQPALQSMPMPPSANDPPPKETRPARAKPERRAAQPKREIDGALAVPETARPRRSTTTTAGAVERPKRYVPEEFDRGGSDGGGRAQPFVSESGRPGMGMRF